VKVVNPVALIHAKIVNNPNTSAFDRAVSAMTLGHMVEANEIYLEIPDDFNISMRTEDLAEALVDDKPVKYIWRNGARIKVKS
jgi:hypothetical protein